ncbi:amylo-alpha-1,6-glucosidase [Ktedonosporobacter rubrisoli]|uniref:Amylo-alpha-1,6-glucosidase n=1 Tax=Ktedonosporobacter rubrisoli TaxID=2509675 RepID=A0A4P6JSV2_KTERU|nr:glycogen debranching N-terminal domain-containing protein [Ktedonosporobacter rubrisoli]QBD78322.1 amylo-alpha-1,6-glucosidase [Ktedonosporobacter rubrisoli]
MGSEIKVGPPVITISQGRTFMVTDKCGYIDPNTNQGIYAIDTRFVSFYKLYINRIPWQVINSNQLTFYASRFHLTNPDLNTEGGKLGEHTVGLTVNRTVSDGIHEEFEVVNYSGEKVVFVLELSIRSDFADIFEVKQHNIIQRGKQQTQWNDQKKCLRTTYDNKNFHRAIEYQITNVSSPVGFANGRLFFQIELEPGQMWQACTDLMLEHGQHIKKAGANSCTRGHKGSDSGGATPSPQSEPTSDFDERQAHWQERCTALTSSNNDVYRAYSQAIKDMGALRIYDMDVSADAWVPAAGVPWFVTLFGRDSLTVSYQNMSVAPEFARGALKRLAEFQADKHDNWNDSQPGKIMHEIRFGELAHFHKIPFTPYYGTADATILYLIVLSEAYRWTGDVNLLKEFRQIAEGCLDWIDHFGDLDGDGFQEYKTFSPLGYNNIAWKDAAFAVVYKNGSQVKQPKALVELQGYVYDAKLRMAEAFEVLGDKGRAQSLRKQAETLRHKFNQAFWMEDEGCYAYGLDPAKKKITSIASNAAYPLWSGIADQEKAEKVARRLLQEDMWSGWGIRTLSSKNPSYNPYYYQLGSVWPQDNGIIAEGFKRYGLSKEANQIIHGVFDAIERFESYRPPEVFAGIHRRGDMDFPVLYPGGANIPQAWATGSIFHMIRTMLGLRADAPNKRLYVNPTLPDWVPEIKLQRLHVGPCSLSIHFWRDGTTTRWEVLENKALQDVKKEDMIQVEASEQYQHS